MPSWPHGLLVAQFPLVQDEFDRAINLLLKESLPIPQKKELDCYKNMRIFHKRKLLQGKEEAWMLWTKHLPQQLGKYARCPRAQVEGDGGNADEGRGGMNFVRCRVDEKT